MPSSKKTSLVRGEMGTHIILEFKPKEFRMDTKALSDKYFEMQEQSKDFHISDAGAIKTGIDKVQKQNLEEKVEELALERLKDIQEKAYQEAYKLGFEEGKIDAQTEAAVIFKKRFEDLEVFLRSVESLRTEIVRQNEEALIKLVFQIAKRVAYREIDQQQDTIRHVLKDVLNHLQEEERIIVHLAPADKTYIDTIRDVFGTEFVGKLSFEVAEDVAKGGCTVETLHGMTDATLEERVERVWQSLVAKIPVAGTADPL